MSQENEGEIKEGALVSRDIGGFEDAEDSGGGAAKPDRGTLTPTKPQSSPNSGSASTKKRQSGGKKIKVDLARTTPGPKGSAQSIEVCSDKNGRLESLDNPSLCFVWQELLNIEKSCLVRDTLLSRKSSAFRPWMPSVTIKKSAVVWVD